MILLCHVMDKVLVQSAVYEIGHFVNNSKSEY